MKTKILIILIVLIYVFPFFSFAQNQTEWPMFHGNQARTGFSDKNEVL